MKTTPRRVIAVGLDGFEASIADAMMRDGRLPAFRKLAEEAAIFALDHGEARETGLAWEHFSTGQEPDAYERWSAVTFDATTYRATQQPARSRPFLADLGVPAVAFDVPYLDLTRATDTRGMANWGAHDPGVRCHSDPPSLVHEIQDRFGPYPAAEFIYGFVWPSPEKTARMAERMTEAAERRGAITRWLLKERLPDWALAITVVAELHSAAEALWHGWDHTHPLHGHASAAAARRGIEGVYAATDRMIGDLHADHPDAVLVVFSMHGMGPNKGDLASMALLPELLYRRSFGVPHLRPRPDWTMPVPALRADEAWSRAVCAQLGSSAATRRSASLWSRIVRKASRLAAGRPDDVSPAALDWMPGARYREFWPRMEAFALPAFYDGQIRVNLRGREASGLVEPDRYAAVLDELEALVRSATDPVTGASLVERIDRPLAGDPFDRTETRCDLKIHWRANAYAMDVPGIGRVGPVPQRRTGGHTGEFGYAAILGEVPRSGPRNVASSFDMVPTILDLLGVRAAGPLSGRSLLDAARTREETAAPA